MIAQRNTTHYLNWITILFTVISVAALAGIPSTTVGQQPPARKKEHRTIFDTILRGDLIRLHHTKTSIDSRYPVRMDGKHGEVTIRAGETKLVELPKPTLQCEWRSGEYKPEGIDDEKFFDFVLVQWKDDGHITWINYQSKSARRQLRRKNVNPDLIEFDPN